MTAEDKILGLLRWGRANHNPTWLYGMLDEIELPDGPIVRPNEIDPGIEDVGIAVHFF